MPQVLSDRICSFAALMISESLVFSKCSTEGNCNQALSSLQWVNSRAELRSVGMWAAFRFTLVMTVELLSNHLHSGIKITYECASQLNILGVLIKILLSKFRTIKITDFGFF